MYYTSILKFHKANLLIYIYLANMNEGALTVYHCNTGRLDKHLYLNKLALAYSPPHTHIWV